MSNFSDETYLPLFRQIRQHWLWSDKPFSKGQAWIDLLLRAHHSEKPYDMPVGNEVVTLLQGELFSSDLRLAEAWGWSRKKVLGYIELLRKEKMMVKKGTTKGTTYFIVNYADWKEKVQQKVQRGDSAGTTKGHKQECKNGKNGKKEEQSKKPPVKKSVIKPHSFSEKEVLTAQYISAAEKLGYTGNIEMEFFRFKNYWLDRSDIKRPGWIRSWSTWISRAVEKQPVQKSKKEVDDAYHKKMEAQNPRGNVLNK